jgi:GGDEF domain-containing protein
LISIRTTGNYLEHVEEQLRAACGAYVHALSSTRQYAVDFDSAELVLFQTHLDSLVELAKRASSREEWESVQASLRGELREYRDKSIERIGKLRSDIQAAAEAMNAFATSVSAAGEDHQKEIDESVKQLRRAQICENLAEIRSIVAAATHAITESVTRMQNAHQLVVAQLRDELRLLHQQVENERRAALLDRATGVWNRQTLDSKLSELLALDEPFSILLVRLRNLKRLEELHSQTMVQSALKALLKRLAAMLSDDVVIGRWTEEHFMAILPLDASSAIGLQREASKRLTGTYTVQENGLSYTLSLQAIAGLVGRPQGSDGAQFMQKVIQMSDSLKNG